MKWIEEMIGRRQSLKADEGIAVSSSGFTKGARLKASKHGIILRDLQSLTEAEILGWGRSVELTLLFYQYSNVRVTLFMSRESFRSIDPDRLKREFGCSPIAVTTFNQASRFLSDRGFGPSVKGRANFGITSQPLEPAYLAGQLVLAVKLEGTARVVSREIRCPTVMSYDDPDMQAGERNVVIEKYELGQTAIIHDGSRISVLLDLSMADWPPLSQFRYARVNGKEEMEHESFEILGADVIGKVSPGPMTIIATAEMPPATSPPAV